MRAFIINTVGGTEKRFEHLPDKEVTELLEKLADLDLDGTLEVVAEYDGLKVRTTFIKANIDHITDY
jgi:hypothetical protein